MSEDLYYEERGPIIIVTDPYNPNIYQVKRNPMWGELPEICPFPTLLEWQYYEDYKNMLRDGIRKGFVPISTGITRGYFGIYNIGLDDIKFHKTYMHRINSHSFRLDVVIIADITVYYGRGKRATEQQWYRVQGKYDSFGHSNFFETINLYNMEDIPQEHPLSEYLIPYLCRADLDREAEEFLMLYYPEALESPMPVNGKILISRMGFKVMNTRLSLDDSVLARVFHAVDDHEVHVQSKEMVLTPFEKDSYKKWRSRYIKINGITPEDDGYTYPRRQFISLDKIYDEENDENHSIQYEIHLASYTEDDERIIIRLGENHQCRETMEQSDESLLRLNSSIMQSDNPHIVFSDGYNNLLSFSYVTDISAKKNFAYILGKGEGAERKRTVYFDGDEPSFLGRYEVYADAKDMSDEEQIDGETKPIPEDEYIELLKERGKEKIVLPLTASESQIAVQSMQFQYNKDYFVGDYVTVEHRRFGLIRPKIQLIGMIESFDQNGRNLAPTFKEV